MPVWEEIGLGERTFGSQLYYSFSCAIVLPMLARNRSGVCGVTDLRLLQVAITAMRDIGPYG